jgi:hypothetical protein
MFPRIHSSSRSKNMIGSRGFVALLIFPVLMGSVSSAADSSAWPHSAAVPRDAYVTFEISQPRSVLDQLLQPRVIQAVTSHPEYQRRRNDPEFLQVVNVIQYLEGRFQTDLHGLLNKSIGGGITLAVGPGEQTLLIVEAEDAVVLNEVHDFFLMIARNEANAQGQSDRVKSADYRGVTGWSLAPGQAHAIVGNRLLFTNNAQTLTAAIDRIQDPNLPNLASLPRYQQAREAFAQPPVAWMFARMDVLKELPQMKAALDQESNPLVTLLLAPLMQALQQSEWLAMSVDLNDLTVTLSVASDGRSADASSPSGFARSAQRSDGALPNLSVPRQIAGLSFYRNLHQFYAAKDDLFPQRTSGLIFFENMMGIFFTGRDLTEEVLAELTPEVRLVVAQQEYAPEVGTPDPQLPGFALVFGMKRPEKFSLVVEEAWQKALGLINFTRGQQAEPGLILDKPIHADVKYTLAYFAPPDEGSRSPADMRFNFQPALAMPGGHLILSSTDALARDLIEALQREAESGEAAVPGRHTIAEIDGKTLAALLEANRGALIRQNMVEKGHTQEQAQGEISMLLDVVRSVGNLSIAAGGEGPEQLRIQLKLDLGQ